MSPGPIPPPNKVEMGLVSCTGNAVLHCCWIETIWLIPVHCLRSHSALIVWDNQIQVDARHFVMCVEWKVIPLAKMSVACITKFPKFLGS